STAVPFHFDPSGTLRVSYTSDAGSGVVAGSLPTTLLSTRDPVVAVPSGSGSTRTMLIAASADGYTVIPGDAVQCEAADPAKWSETATLEAGVRPEPAAAPAGVTTNVDVPMGAVRVSTSHRYIVAVPTVSSLE